MRPSLFVNLLFVCTLLLAGLFAEAQIKKTVLQQQTDSLVSVFRQQQIDTICVFESYCVGCRGSYLSDDSPCATKGIVVPTYVLGKSGSKTIGFYLTNCEAPRSLMVRDGKFWNYYFSRKQEIKSGEIRPFTVFDKKWTGGKPERVRRNHGLNYSFAFYDGKDTTEQYFDQFALTRKAKYADKERKNIYYKQNAASPIRQLAIMLGSAVIEATRR